MPHSPCNNKFDQVEHVSLRPLVQYKPDLNPRSALAHNIHCYIGRAAGLIEMVPVPPLPNSTKQPSDLENCGRAAKLEIPGMRAQCSKVHSGLRLLHKTRHWAS